MARRFLGDTVDLHAGGIDLVFPHHENEIAQSEGFTVRFIVLTVGVRPDLMRDRKRKTAFFDLDFSIRKICIAFLKIR